MAEPALQLEQEQPAQPERWGYIPLGFWLSKHHPALKGAERTLYMALGQFVNAGNRSPTKRELRLATGLSENTVDAALKGLRAAGFLLIGLSDRSANTYTLQRGPWNDPPPATGGGSKRESAGPPPSLWGPIKVREREKKKQQQGAPKVAAAFSPFEPIESAAPALDSDPVPAQAPATPRPPEVRTSTGDTGHPRAGGSCSRSLGQGVELPPKLHAALLALSRGQGALRVLERAQLPRAQQASVVERVLAYDRQKGVDDAARFIHGPIRDVRELELDRAERSEARQHDDDWDKTERELAQAVAAQRIPIFVSPPTPPPPPRTRLEKLRDDLTGLLIVPGLSDEKRAAIERELREVEAQQLATG